MQNKKPKWKYLLHLMTQGHIYTARNISRVIWFFLINSSLFQKSLFQNNEIKNQNY